MRQTEDRQADNSTHTDSTHRQRRELKGRRVSCLGDILHRATMNLLWNYVGFYFAKATLWKRVWGEMCEGFVLG